MVESEHPESLSAGRRIQDVEEPNNISLQTVGHLIVFKV